MKKLAVIFVLLLGLLANSTLAQYLGLSDFTFTPDSIDVRADTKSVTFTVTATETDGVSIMFRPIGFDYIGVEHLDAIGDGVFQKTIIYPVNTLNRTEEIFGIQLVDSDAHLGEFFSTTDLATLGFKTNFQIISNYVTNPPKSRKRVRFF